jgi:cellulose synthase (UDP-forming)
LNFDPSAFTPIILILGLYLVVAPLLPVKKTWARSSVAIVCVLLGLRYVYWRLNSTVLPYDEQFGIEFIWIWFVFLVEVAIYIEAVVFFLIMSRYKPRHEEADAGEAALNARGVYPPVDVFIPTYNEPPEVLEKTIVGAAGIDYPNLTVWVLDDGKRDWLRGMCETEGVRYLTRPDNSHAKAGNLNNALLYAEGEFIAIFDADFVPHRNFLIRTIGLFDDPEVGIVQTPQYFFNQDPIQFNLGLTKDWPDEQRLFFDKMAECRDAWDVAFCCGSCSVTRRAALRAAGDQYPTESITEDLLTTLKLSRAGYKTRYLNERLSMGLAAESLEGFFVQRARWCRGGIQSIFLPDGPLGPGIPLLNRLLFFPWNWLIQYPSRFVIMIIPIVVLWTGLMPLHFTSIEELIFYQFPVFLTYYLFMHWILPHHYMPVLSTAQSWFATFRLLPTVISSVIKPFGVPFRVTPKGTLNNMEGFDALTFFFILIFIVTTALGVIVNLFPETDILEEIQFFPVALFWAGLNIVTLLLALLMCFDAPRKRSEERFDAEEDSVLHGDGSAIVRVYDLSLNGCRVSYSGLDNIAQIDIEGVGLVGATSLRHFPWDNPTYTSLKFTHTPETRRAMTRKLFGGRYSNVVRQVDTGTVVGKLFRRLFGTALT